MFKRLHFRVYPLFWVNLGTLVEYYDYALYGFVASKLTQDFFPKQTSGLIWIFVFFWSAHLAKPLGGYLFGSLSDRVSRTFALYLSMVGMILSAGVMVVLPSYTQIGYFAPLGLLMCRLVQGLSVSGESDTARIILLELNEDKWGCSRINSIGLASMLGIVLASWVSGLHLHYRECYALGALLGVLLLLLRVFFPFESFVQVQKKLLSQSLWKTYRNRLLVIFLLCGSVGGMYHFYFVYLRTYLGSFYIENTLSMFYTWSLLFYVLTSLVTGYLVDKLSAQKILPWGCIALSFTVLLNGYCYYFDHWSAWFLLMTSIGLSIFQAPLMFSMVQDIEPEARCRILSVGHGLGSIILSGTTPAICFWTNDFFNHSWVSFMYFSLLALLGIIGVFLMLLMNLSLSR